jgi:hypothetical protein
MALNGSDVVDARATNKVIHSNMGICQAAPQYAA